MTERDLRDPAWLQTEQADYDEFRDEQDEELTAEGWIIELARQNPWHDTEPISIITGRRTA